jgi:hypothetical protein
VLILVSFPLRPVSPTPAAAAVAAAAAASTSAECGLRARERGTARDQFTERARHMLIGRLLIQGARSPLDRRLIGHELARLALEDPLVLVLGVASSRTLPLTACRPSIPTSPFSFQAPCMRTCDTGARTSVRRVPSGMHAT